MGQQAAAAASAAAGLMCTHDAIRDALRFALTDGDLFIRQHEDDTERADQQSIQCLVNHLRPHYSAVRALLLRYVRFSDEGFNVLLAYFASNTTAPLTTVALCSCDFGPRRERHSQLLSAIIRTNESITDVTISYPKYQGVTLQNVTLDSDILVGLLQKNNPHLQKLSLHGFTLQLRNVDALQQALGNIPRLTELSLFSCQIDDTGAGAIANGLVGNTTMQVLDISGNFFTPNGIPSFTRLLESTQLKVLNCGSSRFRLNNGEPSERFATALSNNQFMTTLDMYGVIVSSSIAGAIFQGLTHNSTLKNLTLGEIQNGNLQPVMESLIAMKGLKRLSLTRPDAWLSFLQNQSFVPSVQENTSLEELPGLDVLRYPQFEVAIKQIHLILARNCSMRRARSLLALQPRTGLHIAPKSGIWYKAMAKLGPASNRLSGASAIFYILQMRPVIVGIQLKQPPSSSASASATTQQGASSHRRRQREVAEQERHALDGSSSINNVEDVANTRDGGKRARRS